jgi:hypothetical protein
LVIVTPEEITARVEAAKDAPLGEQVAVYEAALNDLETILAKAVPR